MFPCVLLFVYHSDGCVTSHEIVGCYGVSDGPKCNQAINGLRSGRTVLRTDI